MKYSHIVASNFLCFVLGAPVLSQTRSAEPAATITRANRTLNNIDHLIDLAVARNKEKPSIVAPVVGEVPWISMFDGKTMDGWKKTDFAGGGPVSVDASFAGGAAIVVKPGDYLSGFNWTKPAPKTNYELTLDFMKIEGNDFACGLTFPVGDSHASLILGGWGGGVVGISSIEGLDASENQTTKYMSFPKGKWFKVIMRVTPEKLEAWLNDKKIVDQDIHDKRISLRPGEIDKSVPIGISTFQTSTAFRGIAWRSLARSAR